MELSGGAGDLAIALLAGVVSFLSPCVLPLVPGYLSFITGVTPAEPAWKEGHSARAVLLPSLLFVLGFSIVFMILGASASALGDLLLEYQRTIQRVLGVFVITMGFLLLGIVKVPWLYGEARFDMAKTHVLGRGSAVVTGMAFAFGWTPCVGPILTSILAISMSSGDAARGAVLLGVYSVGLGIPLVTVGLLYGRLRGALGWLNRRALTINRVAGVLLMLLGVLIYFDQLSRFSSWVTRYLPWAQIL